MPWLKVLHLEDDSNDAELVKLSLINGGIDADITRVDTRTEFITEINHQPYNLILADYWLPSFDGITALELTQQHCPHVPFIFVSGAIGEELAIDTLKRGATDYVLKQRLERLAPAVKRALREAEMASERKKIEAERDQLLLREQQARQEAQEANRTKDEFLAVVSHELRTPLTAILGWTRLLRGEQLDQISINRALETIERNVKAQAQLIEDLLDISRIMTGKLHLEMRPVDLSSVIKAAIDSARPIADSKHIELKLILEPWLRQVNGDPTRLQQIVWNLLSNAIKFTPAGGKISIELSQTLSHAEITVTDNGKGISADFLPYVFERFRQADSTNTRAHSGLGLGLSIVRHLVDLHNGSVIADSRGEGQGATFIVSLPLINNVPVENKSESNFLADHSKMLKELIVMVVDDDLDTREMIEVVLRQSGAQVKVAGTVSEALLMMESWTPDLLVSDISMPGENGYDLIRQIRASNRPLGRIPAVALTAQARTEDRLQALSAGFQMHVPKPVEPAELLSVLASLANLIGKL